MFDKTNTWKGTRAGSMIILFALGGCSFLPKEPAPLPVEEPVIADPNTGTTVITEEETSVTPPVHNTMMDENEELRILLSEALSEKRRLEAELEQEVIRAERAEAELAARQQEVQQLAMRLETELGRSIAFETELRKHDAEKKTLAEMYAAEKHQRLMFEKELLEREIASRTIVKKDG